ncbi:MAG: putative baseplate assembly protein [Parerythrobacter sp.]
MNEQPQNRPGKPAIDYRLGTYGSFKAQLMNQLSRPVLKGYPSLAALKSRQLDDSAIALLDAWAMVADVLTFYQERIANENYLKTATERRSVLALARAIGYELNPGVSASTQLAFTVETSPGSPETVTIPSGLQVMSIPGQNEQPQTFETAHVFTARPEWNAMRPRLTQPQTIAFKGEQLYLWTADTTGLSWLLQDVQSLNSASLFFLSQPPEPAVKRVTVLPVEQLSLTGTNQNLKAGQRILFVGAQPNNTRETLIKTIQRVEVKLADNLTQVYFATKPAPLPAFTSPEISFGTLFSSSPLLRSFATSSIRRQLETAVTEQDIQAVIALGQWSTSEFVAEAIAPTPTTDSADNGIFVLRQQLSGFGHNAPFQTTRSADDVPGQPPASSRSWDSEPVPTVWQNSRWEDYAQAPNSPDLYLERSLTEITAKSWVVLEAGDHQKTFQVTRTETRSLADYAISGKSTGLKLVTAAGKTPNKDTPIFPFRATTIHAQSEKLMLAHLPIETPLERKPFASNTSTGVISIELDTIVLGFQPGQTVLVQGRRAGSQQVMVVEAATIKQSVHKGGNTTIFFTALLQHRYVRDSVTVHANVVRATHGETVAEAIGSGNGAIAHQTFKLNKSPLTYTDSSAASGSQSSLSVRVNGILWTEARGFYGLSPQSEQYVVHIADDSTARIIFGDSQQGARLPTGTENVTALYRSGIGPEGEVPANSLSLLKQKPLGVRSVFNPLPATGAQAPEQLETARSSAPLTVLTLDRIVSLQDYENFASAFAGIGKAAAVEIWTGQATQIHLTIASASGDRIEHTSQIYMNLKQAISAQRDPGQPFALASFEARSFSLSARLRLNQRYEEEPVLSQIKQTLRSVFSFTHRHFGEGVSAAEVIALMQSVAGVVSVDLDQLYRTALIGSTQHLPAHYLPAATTTWNGQQTVLAELLLINPAGINLEVIKP